MRKTARRPWTWLLIILIAAWPVPSAAGQAQEATLLQEIEQLAKQGDGEALYALALHYDLGGGPPAAKRLAIDLYRQAAKLHVAGACLNLGMKYEFGNGVPRDPKQAAALYEEAARQGWPMAQFFLGRLLLDGVAGQADPDRGRHWLRQAAEAGYPGAAELLEETGPAPTGD